jgi:hypothetical protein
MKLSNFSSAPIKDLLMKLNQNHFGVALDEGIPPTFTLAPGE